MSYQGVAMAAIFLARGPSPGTSAQTWLRGLVTSCCDRDVIRSDEVIVWALGARAVTLAGDSANQSWRCATSAGTESPRVSGSRRTMAILTS